MKTKYCLLFAIPLALAACQSEPEVGDLLYPATPETYEAKVYINETAMPGNQHTTKVLRTPYGVQAQADTVSFYVRLTKPVAQDVTVGVAQVDSLAAGFADDATALPAKFTSVVTPSVTIPAGSMVSSAPVRVALTHLDEVEASGVAPIAISTIQGEAVAGADHQVYYVAVNYEETQSRVKSQSSKDLKALTKIDPSSYTVTVGGATIAELNDGNKETYYVNETPENMSSSSIWVQRSPSRPSPSSGATRKATARLPSRSSPASMAPTGPPSPTVTTTWPTSPTLPARPSPSCSMSPSSVATPRCAWATAATVSTTATTTTTPYSPR